MRMPLAIVGFFLLFAALLPAASNALPYQPFPENWQAVLDGFTASGQIPGAVVIVKSPNWGVRVGTTGYADLLHKVKPAPDMSFRVGSVTKAFTAQLVLMLEQQGKLKLTDPILTYLGDNSVVAAIPNISKITIADCLQMKSGIANYLGYPAIATSPDNSPHKQYTPTELLAVLSPNIPNVLSPDFAPGATYPNPYWVAFMGPNTPPTADYPPYAWWSYSNSNYILLGMVAEKVSGMTMQDAVHTMICQTLGLDDTSFATDLTTPSKMMHGYTRLDALRNPKYTDWVDVTDIDPSYAWAAGAIISTPWDLLHFLDSIFKTNLLLSKGTKEKWLTFVSAAIHWADVEYGMGGLMQAQRAYGELRGHGGAYPGYKTVMYRFYDSDISLIISVDTWDGQPEVDIMDSLMPLVTGAATDPTPAQHGAIPYGSAQVTLNWRPGRVYGDSYNVYWGTNRDRVTTASARSHDGVEMRTTTTTAATIGPLDPQATYYWRVDTVLAQGTVAGPTWSFTTGYGRPRGCFSASAACVE